MLAGPVVRKRYKKSFIFLVLLIVFLSIYGVSRCKTTPPSSRSESSYEVYITRTGSKYHLDECRYLRESKIPISLEDAKEQGYSPCKVCDPPQ